MSLTVSNEPMDSNGEPEPRVGFKLTSKRPTAADQFADYQNEYEARAESSVHGIRQVEEHNKNYPNINEELDKRRSTAQANCSHKKHHKEEKNDHQRCSTSRKAPKRIVNRLNEPAKMRCACACLKRRAIGVTRNSRRESRAADASCKQRGRVCASVLEKKFRGRYLRFSNKETLINLIGNICCDCKQEFRKVLCNEDTSDRDKKELREIYSRRSRDSDRNSVNSKYSSKSKIVATPGSNRSSVTTYRSDGSMSQEPMV